MADIEPPETIICVDCGGLCHLLMVQDDADPDDPGGANVVVSYRCEDCNDRWDVEMSDEEP